MITLQNILNNPQQVDLVLKSMTPIKTPVVDNVFKTQRLVPSTIARVEEIVDICGAVPIVSRTSVGVNITRNVSDAVTYIEAYPIRINERLTASEANDYKALRKEDYTVYVADILERIRRRVRTTTEALASQALTGKISYPLLYDTGQTGTYEIDFTRGGVNPVPTYSPSVKWNANGASVDKALVDLINITQIIQKNGYGAKIRFWAGISAFQALMALVQKSGTKNGAIPAQVNGPAINVAGFTVELANFSYFKPDGTSVKVVPDNKILAWDEGAPFTLLYLAIDNFKAGLSPRKLFIQSWMPEHGKWLEIIAESKPLPVPVIKAMCWAEVVA